MLSPQNKSLIEDLKILKIWLNHTRIAPKDATDTVEKAIRTIKTLGYYDPNEFDPDRRDRDFG
jgi:hypothetical protein